MLARAVQARVTRPEMVRVFSSREYDASRMTVLLRSLRLLVTSRYHAGVLSLGARVPQVAVGHDLRLRTLYEDLGLRERFFVDPHSYSRTSTMFERLSACVEELLERPEQVRTVLEKGQREHRQRAERNQELLARELHSFVGAGGLS